MSIQKRGEPFSSGAQKAWLASEEWNPAKEAFYKLHPDKRRVMEWRRADKNTLRLGYDFEENATSINELHGVNFLKVVIPAIIERVRASGSKRKIKILDMGCGLGFFNDQLRAKFGEEIKVYGTGIDRLSLIKRKAAIMRQIKNGKIEMDETAKLQLLSETDGTLHPNDAKWNSIEELSDFPEFDLIIDSEGETIYAGGTGVNFFPKSDTTQNKIICAIKKLMPGGILFISRIHEHHKGLTPARRQQMEAIYGVKIEDNNDAHFPAALKITKLPNDKIKSAA